MCGKKNEGENIPKKIDLTGQRYGRLVVLHEAPKDGRAHSRWVCQCDCGNTFVTSTPNLRNGDTQSCGCLRKERASETHKMHGDAKSVLYKRWKAMRKRCYNPNNADYPHYGGRGIRVCDEWQNYVNFREWAIQNGYTDDNSKYLSLDRINVDGDYSPDNCRFVSMKVQCNNRTNNKRILIDGQSYTISELADKMNLKYTTLYARLRRDINKKDLETIINFPTTS